jgi:hypothetical protein
MTGKIFLSGGLSVNFNNVTHIDGESNGTKAGKLIDVTGTT